MPNTYTRIQTVETPNGGASNFSFTSIPQTYTDLLIMICGRSSDSNPTYFDAGCYLQFNGDGAANYSFMRHYAISPGGMTGGDKNSNLTSAYWGVMPANQTTANIFGNAQILIPNYRSSAHKPFIAESVNENSSATAVLTYVSGLWRNTAAITSISVGTAPVQYSKAVLYGIVNA